MSGEASYDILNAISDSGICIVRVKDSKRLLSNNRMREMKDDYWRGEGFYGSFDTREFQKMLRETEEDPSHRTEFFDVFSRHSFSIAINRIDVDDEEAMLIRLAPISDDLHGSDIMMVNRQLLDTVMRIYPMIWQRSAEMHPLILSPRMPLFSLIISRNCTLCLKSSSL